MKARCINIDWLNVSFLEDVEYPRDANYFREQGIEVKERAYGTPVFNQFFEIRQNGIALYEIRRDPHSKKGHGGIMHPRLCQIRLNNRACYTDDPVNELRKFAIAYGYEYQGISRVDLALDFNLFDNGADPKKFILRYMRNEISKINQCNVSAHGKDNWTGRDFNSLKWGSEASLITTKLYNKSLEMKEQSEKPYIIRAWVDAGLDISKPIWRVEFSIKAESRHVVSTDGELIEMNLSAIDNREKLLWLFMGLSQKYFHFKRVEYVGDKPKRKDRCKDVETFTYAKGTVPYRPIHIPKLQVPDKFDRILIRRLQAYQADEIWRNGKNYDALSKVIAYMKNRFIFDDSLATAVQ